MARAARAVASTSASLAASTAFFCHDASARAHGQLSGAPCSGAGDVLASLVFSSSLPAEQQAAVKCVANARRAGVAPSGGFSLEKNGFMLSQVSQRAGRS